MLEHSSVLSFITLTLNRSKIKDEYLVYLSHVVKAHISLNSTSFLLHHLFSNLTSADYLFLSMQNHWNPAGVTLQGKEEMPSKLSVLLPFCQHWEVQPGHLLASRSTLLVNANYSYTIFILILFIRPMTFFALFHANRSLENSADRPFKP